MNKNNFLLLNLEDSKTKDIANVINNDSGKKILDYLTNKQATETELAKKLNLPLSTVHYNLQKLLKTKLIVWETAHYSEKGKQVKHYKLANKYIIIAPKDSPQGFLDKLKSIIPTFLIMFLGSVFYYYFQAKTYTETNTAIKAATRSTEDVVFEESAAPQMMATGASECTRPIVTTCAHPVLQDFFIWFFLGAITAIVIYLLINYIRKRK